MLPEARWAELRAGKAARRGCEEEDMLLLARWAEFAAGKEDLGGDIACEDEAVSVRLRDGMLFELDIDVALGVVGDVGFFIDGGGGGGIILRSCSTFADASDPSFCTMAGMCPV